MSRFNKLGEDLFEDKGIYYREIKGYKIPLKNGKATLYSKEFIDNWIKYSQKGSYILSNPAYDLFLVQINELISLLPKEKVMDFFKSDLLVNMDYDRFKVMMKLMIGKTFDEDKKENKKVESKKEEDNLNIKDIDINKNTHEFIGNIKDELTL